jgi:hypothetical protein
MIMPNPAPSRLNQLRQFLFRPSIARSEQFNPEEQKKLLTEYRSLIGLPANLTFSSDALDKYASSKSKNIDAFEKTKGPNDINIHEQLKDVTTGTAEVTAARKQVNTDITKALESQPELKTALKDYKESIATFQQLLKKTTPKPYKAEELIGAMKDVIDNGRTKLIEQQTQELNAFTKLTTEDDFKKNLKTSLNIVDDSGFEVTKKNMIDDLKKAQKDQLAAFDKSSQDSLKALHSASAKEMDHLLFVANLYKNNQKMREQFAATVGTRGPVSISIGDKERDKAIISGIKPEDITVIESLTGKQITKKSDDTFSMQFGMKLFHPKYYLDPRNNVEGDLMLMAQAVKACGYSSITMNVNFENTTVAQERAKQAYKACIDSGFDPEKIAIKVNGKLVKTDELFKDSPRELNALKQRASALKQELPTLESLTKKADLTEIKADIKKIRDDAAKNAPPVEPAVDNGPRIS